MVAHHIACTKARAEERRKSSFNRASVCKSVHLSSLRYTSLAVTNQIKGLRSLHLSIIQPEILPKLSFFGLTYIIALVLAMVVLSSFTFVVKMYTAMPSRTDFGAVIPSLVYQRSSIYLGRSVRNKLWKSPSRRVSTRLAHQGSTKVVVA